MNSIILDSYIPAIPEIFLACMALLALMIGVFKTERAVGYVASFSRFSFLGALFLLVIAWDPEIFVLAFRKTAVNHMFINDSFTMIMKGVILVGAILSMYISGDYLKTRKVRSAEYYVLHILAVLGMMVMISAYDFIVMYMGLEMMSFCLYILAAYHTNNIKSSEAGLKYFVLGSLSSGVMLYGISLLYGVAGDTSYVAVQSALASLHGIESNPLIAVALVFTLVGLVFKISAVPFHMWTPDVYEGAPTPVTAFMATIVKVASFTLLIRVLIIPLLPLAQYWADIFLILSIITMAVGTLMAIMQNNMKRLLAFSSIGHVGFMLIGLVTLTQQGILAILFYLIIYAIMTLGAFSVLLCIQSTQQKIENVDHLAGLNKTSPFLAATMALFMLSIAGIPPLAGFWAKFFVLQTAVYTGFWWLALIAVIFSVVGAYYALRVIKVMYFEEPSVKFTSNIPRNLKMVVLVLAGLVVFLGLSPDSLYGLLKFVNF
jgi:NADH-quinone oxidoreductase subunit N